MVKERHAPKNVISSCYHVTQKKVHGIGDNMTVRELIKELEQCDQDSIVIMSSDGEGNTYSPLADIDDSHVYEAESTWGGYIGLKEITPELVKQGYTEEDLIDGEPCVVLWPTN